MYYYIHHIRPRGLPSERLHREYPPRGAFARFSLARLSLINLFACTIVREYDAAPLPLVVITHPDERYISTGC